MTESARVPQSADALAREVMRLTRKSPADRSLLRHSLGKAPEEAALGVHRIVTPFVSDSASDAEERAYYLVAALIASQPRSARDQRDTRSTPDSPPDGTTAQGETDDAAAPTRRWRNLGYSLAQAVDKGGNAGSLEKHLQLLTRQDVTGLYRHLPRLILQLRGDQVRIDWGVLTRDLTRWARDPRLVAKEWAQSYYRTSERLTAARKRKNAQATGDHDNEETPS